MKALILRMASRVPRPHQYAMHRRSVDGAASLPSIVLSEAQAPSRLRRKHRN